MTASTWLRTMIALTILAMVADVVTLVSAALLEGTGFAEVALYTGTVGVMLPCFFGMAGLLAYEHFVGLAEEKERPVADPV